MFLSTLLLLPHKVSAFATLFLHLCHPWTPRGYSFRCWALGLPDVLSNGSSVILTPLRRQKFCSADCFSSHFTPSTSPVPSLLFTSSGCWLSPNYNCLFVTSMVTFIFIVLALVLFWLSKSPLFPSYMHYLECFTISFLLWYNSVYESVKTKSTAVVHSSSLRYRL